MIKKPIKVTRTYTQKMTASASRVFPLLCPVRELEWVPDWPLIVAYTDSGVAEQDCVFLTKEDETENSIWMITRHEPENYFVEMVKITPSETVCKLQIQLTIKGIDSCDADISYTYVALTKKGEEVVNSFTAEYYETLMKGWETQINSFLSV